MTQSRIERLSISFTVRNARKRGPTSSGNWNDSIAELSRDLAEIYAEWNGFLYPLTSTLPDGTVDTNVNAFSGGLDGQTIYAKSDSDATDTTYYNTANLRPNTIYEQLSALYTYVDNININLSNSISGVVFSAGNISIVDADSLYDANNVEEALAEVKELVDAYTSASVYLPLAGGQMSGAIQLVPMTTTQRDALTPVNGMLIYNSTTGTVQAYTSGSWSSL